MIDKATLKDISLFQGIAECDIETLAKVLTVQEYRIGDIIFREGDAGSKLYIILKGSVKIYRELREGEDQTLTILKEGQFFGELSLLDKAGHTATAEALRTTKIALLNSDDFDELSKSNPKLGCFLLKQVATSVCVLLRDMDEKMIDLVKYIWEFGAKA